VLYVSFAKLISVAFVEAYVLVNCEAGKSWEIVEAALRVDNVKMAHAVTGEYDVVAFIEFTDMEMLTDILDKFQAMKGVQRTRTAVAIPPKLK
jgi:DNA-binding Lrp family transcriptional regulator